MSFRLPILIIGITGTVVFLAIGVSGVLPWEFAGPVAAAFIVGWVFSEVKEQFKTKKAPEIAKVPRKPKSKPVPEKVPEEVPENIRETGIILDEAVKILPKEVWRHGVTLRKGDTARIEVNADDPVDVDLVTRTEYEKIAQGKTYSAERSRAWVRNATIEYEARRTGLWFVLVNNPNRTPVEVGVRISVDEPS